MEFISLTDLPDRETQAFREKENCLNVFKYALPRKFLYADLRFGHTYIFGDKSTTIATPKNKLGSNLNIKDNIIYRL